TGVPIAPAAGTVPTADGAGGATWAAPVPLSSVTLSDSLAADPSGITMVADGVGPDLTLRRIRGISNVITATGAGDTTTVALDPNLTSMQSISGTTSTSLIDLTVSNQVRIGTTFNAGNPT